jgi:hypothetical protein
MIRPLEDRTQPGEYVNRVRHTEHGHSPGSRDFAYEIGQVSDEQPQGREQSPEFGQDTFERSESERQPAGDDPGSEPGTDRDPASTDESNLDITV